MSLPPTPPPLESLGTRAFSFYPPILNFEHNEWIYRRGVWSEILVANARTGEEVWIPRRFLGEMSSVDEPVVIVGLVKELEYQAGSVWPHQKRLIEMPAAVGDAAPTLAPTPDEAAPVHGIRMESAESRMGRLVGGFLLIGILICLITVTVYRQGVLRPRLNYTVKDQSYLELNHTDDYYSVVRKLGPPAADAWKSESGEIQFRALTYPQRSYIVILMGTDRKSATYVGTLDSNWRPVHSVRMRTGGDTSSMLRGLKKF